MPIFRYKCESCGHTFTKLEPRSTDGNAPKVCEKCGEKAVKRVISRVGVIYKGSGFHSTDYGPKRNKTVNKEESGPKDSETDSKN